MIIINKGGLQEIFSNKDNQIYLKILIVICILGYFFFFKFSIISVKDYVKLVL